MPRSTLCSRRCGQELGLVWYSRMCVKHCISNHSLSTKQVFELQSHSSSAIHHNATALLLSHTRRHITIPYFQSNTAIMPFIADTLVGGPIGLVIKYTCVAQINHPSAVSLHPRGLLAVITLDYKYACYTSPVCVCADVRTMSA